jgi:GDP-D-mannose dehydratase
LVGNAEKAKRVVGWRPEVAVPELVQLLVRAKVERLSSEQPAAVHTEAP